MWVKLMKDENVSMVTDVFDVVNDGALLQINHIKWVQSWVIYACKPAPTTLS